MKAMNLNPMRKFLEAQMVDTIRVVRNDGTTGDTWDDGLGRYVESNVSSVVYEGLALLSTKGWQPQDILDAGHTEARLYYRVILPIGSPELERDDIVTFMDSLRDEQLVGKQFLVVDRNFTTFTVGMAYFVNAFEPARPR